MQRAAVFFGLSLAAIASAHGQPVSKVVVIERGIYLAETVKAPVPLHDVGSLAVVANARLVQSTTLIPGRKGMRFGMRYLIEGVPPGSRIGLRLVTHFPDAALKDPATRREVRRVEHFVTKTAGAVHYRDYFLDQDWEVIPGLWIFEFWDNDLKIGEQRFCIVALNEGAKPQGNESDKQCAEDLVG